MNDQQYSVTSSPIKIGPHELAEYYIKNAADMIEFPHFHFFASSPKFYCSNKENGKDLLENIKPARRVLLESLSTSEKREEFWKVLLKERKLSDRSLGPKELKVDQNHPMVILSTLSILFKDSKNSKSLKDGIDNSFEGFSLFERKVSRRTVLFQIHSTEYSSEKGKGKENENPKQDQNKSGKQKETQHGKNEKATFQNDQNQDYLIKHQENLNNQRNQRSQRSQNKKEKVEESSFQSFWKSKKEKTRNEKEKENEAFEDIQFDKYSTLDFLSLWDCGQSVDTVTCSLSPSGQFSIFGTGPMKKCYPLSLREWDNNRSKIISVITNGTVSSIGQYAFYDCDNLVTLNFGPSLTILGNNCFQDCDGLINLTFSPYITSIGYCSFYLCRKLQRLRIPSSVETIDIQAFFFCDSLAELIIEDGVKNINDYAFHGCKMLTPFTIPQSVISIGSAPFSLCYYFTDFIVDENNGKYESRDGALIDKWNHILIEYPGGKSGSYQIPSDILIIGTYAFGGCSLLTSVLIPGSVLSIGSYAFYYCIGLSNLTLQYGIQIIDNNAFEECLVLTTVIIPSSVTEINSYVFYGCMSLNNVTYCGENDPGLFSSSVFSGSPGSLIIYVPSRYKSTFFCYYTNIQWGDTISCPISISNTYSFSSLFISNSFQFFCKIATHLFLFFGI